MTLFSFLLTFLVLLLVDSTISQIRPGLGDSNPTFVVTAPKYARFDVATTFSISVSTVASGPETIRLQLRTSENEVMLNETTLTFTADGVQTWSVVIDSNRMQQRTFNVTAKHRSIVKFLEVSMSDNSGYIMIQTDKTIYTPRQTVMYRVIGLDNDQRFAQWPLTVDIKNPDMIILERQHHSSVDAFMGRNFSLPKDATQGTWTIEAYFTGSKVKTTRTVKFDVHEYVLPTFKAQVSAQEKVLVSSTNWLRVDVKAVYSYGQPVQGRAQLRLGVVGGTKITLFNVTYSQPLNSTGQHTFTIPVSDLRNHTSWFPDGARLYLEANVTEAATGEVGKAVAMDSYFANPYYKIFFTESKKYFKPGFSFNFIVSVKAANGEPASNTNIYAIVDMRNENGTYLPGGFSTMLTLDSNGRLSHRFATPVQATRVKIQIYTLDPRTPDWSQDEFESVKFKSPSNTYLQLEQAANDILLAYTPPANLTIGPPDLVTVLVLSKGRLIYTDSVQRNARGLSRLTLPQEVLTAAAPKARVLAYFFAASAHRTHIVSDNLLIDTEDVCREELELSHPSHASGARLPFLPKQETDLIVTGGGQMRVGLLAVDKAVFFLKDETSLSREQMFDILGDSDDGQGIGDGENTDKIFEYSGLQYVELTETAAMGIHVQKSVQFDMDRLPGLNLFITNRRMYDPGFPQIESSSAREESIPLDQVRKYFPESWLFREITLPEDGMTFETVTMPDSITTWAFTAVGVGREGGVCVSRPLELTVFQPFFTQVRLPYKAVRLEEVRINIGIYNYKNFDINVRVSVRGGVGVCFTEGTGGKQDLSYSTILRGRQTNSESIRLIPLVMGSVEITVDVRSVNGLERDIVTRTLHVVAEGHKKQKVITFPLDPTGQNSPIHDRRQETHTATITNRIVGGSRQQFTRIDLYMPEDIVQGSERCQISACGDLMGDIISTAVINGDSLFDRVVPDAEEAVGNLAPAVHALLYLNDSSFMTPEVASKGHRHVTIGVSRLLTYRNQNGSFSLSTSSQPATWLTALVLKTLCQADRLAFIDHKRITTPGFQWLLQQINSNGTLIEIDRRLAQPSRDYDVMLSAETLIALQECSTTRSFTDSDNQLMYALSYFLKSAVDGINSPLVMAKTAYALTLHDPTDPASLRAVQRLDSMKRTTVEGLIYWSVKSEQEPPLRPFWYHSGTRASSIEASAYGLLVFALQSEAGADAATVDEELSDEHNTQPDYRIHLDGIAGWLIQKRNSRGAFIGALDTAAASQALSKYSLIKQGDQIVNLHCNVTTNPAINYTHSFDFNQLDAIRPKTLPDVPVGRQLHVETTGTGLGLMQVRVAYNVPVAANADCKYNVTITRHSVSYDSLANENNPMCQFCNMGCGNADDDDVRLSVSASRDQMSHGAGRNESRGRGHGRFRRERIGTSSRSICIEVCIRSTSHHGAGRTILEIEMLSGFQPYHDDVKRLIDRRESLSISGLVWVPETSIIEIQFNQVPHVRPRCVSFRAIERFEVARRNPANVRARAHEDQEPTCFRSYDPVVAEVNLAVYCANPSNNNQGQCRCFSGLCGTCPAASTTITYPDVRRLVCNSQYIHKVRQSYVNTSDNWIDMNFDVLSTLKNKGQPVVSPLHMVTPKQCGCPHAVGFGTEQPVFFFGSNVDIFINRNNEHKNTYVVDDSTTFIRSSRNSIAEWIRMATDSTCNN